jgi:hypothetical protein
VTEEADGVWLIADRTTEEKKSIGSTHLSAMSYMP